MPGTGRKVTRARNRSAGLEPVAGPPVKKEAENRGRARVSAVRRVRRAAVRPMTAQNVFHLIFQLELDLFQPDFFELFGLRQIGAIA